MDEENENKIQTPEVKTLAEDIQEFNKKLDEAVEKLNEWKTNLFNLQEEFVEKLKKRTSGMKIQ